MSSRFPAAVLAIALPVLSTASPALACVGECYDKIRTPDVYRVVDRPVVVQPGFREVVVTRPTVVMQTERVMVAPRRVGYVQTPDVYRTEFQEIVVRPAGYRWKSTYGLYGERRCKVPVPAEIKVVPREVFVRPGRRVRVVEPAVYAVRERAVAVRPAQRLVVDYPPVIARERASVLVRRGTTAWVRAGSYGW
ncbi:MAG TPA: hypothetical protein VEA77_02890 [Hyphomicrobium sp.]|nr:hypothetical protein [Hyphomicrobium sp.]